MPGMAWLTSGSRLPVVQTQLAPEGLEFSEDVSEGRWVEESLHGWARVHSLMPAGFQAYARLFHRRILEKSWSSRPVVHGGLMDRTDRPSLMQFERIARLSEDPQDMYRDPPWGHLPQRGSIPTDECRALVNVLREFTKTPDRCFFCLWEGYGNIDAACTKQMPV